MKPVCWQVSQAARQTVRANLLARNLASEEETEQAQGDAEAKAASCTAARANSRVAESEIEVARSRVAFKQAELQRTYITAPFDSRVLDILAQPGEFIGSRRVFSSWAGSTGCTPLPKSMKQIYRRVEIGQTAQISSDALAEPLSGKVEFIHLKVAKQDEIGTDPAAHKDARIIEVEILLDKPELAAALTNLQVDIVIGN